MLSFNMFNNLSRKSSKPNNNDYWLNFYISSTCFKFPVLFYILPNYKKINFHFIYKNSNNFQLYFLKHEPFYTKLKYSRVPQFDTSSGAAASFLSGMYGFLVCEKFGFELIDSGDFLFLVIYAVIFYFFSILLLTILNTSSNFLLVFFSIIKSFFFK